MKHNTPSGPFWEPCPLPNPNIICTNLPSGPETPHKWGTDGRDGDGIGTGTGTGIETGTGRGQGEGRDRDRDGDGTGREAGGANITGLRTQETRRIRGSRGRGFSRSQRPGQVDRVRQSAPNTHSRHVYRHKDMPTDTHEYSAKDSGTM